MKLMMLYNQKFADLQCIYVQFVNSLSCKLEIKFMKPLPLKELDASSISKEIVGYFREIGVSLEKLILFTIVCSR